MGIEAIFLGIALVSVAVTRGSYKALMKTKLNHLWTLGAVLAGHLAITFIPFEKSQYDTFGLAILLGTYVFLFGFCIANLELRGMWIVLTGIASNAFVIGLNKGMPVSNSGGFIAKESIKHQPATSVDLLPWLSDIIPLNFASIAISVGDLVFGAGLIAVCIFASRKTKLGEVMVPDEEMLIETDFERIDYNVDLTANEVVIEDDFEVQAEDVFEPVGQPAELLITETKTPSPLPDETSDSAPVATPSAMMRSSQGPGSSKSDKKRAAKAEGIRERRRHKKWQKTHGLAALPSKEELGYDEGSMEIVEIAD